MVSTGIRFEGDLDRTLRRAQKDIRRDMKRELRWGGNFLRRKIRRTIDRVFKEPSGKLKKAQKVSVRSRRNFIIVIVGPKPGSLEFAYGSVLERGGVVSRRASRRAPAHTATYQKTEFIAPSVREANPVIFQRLGRSFRALG